MRDPYLDPAVLAQIADYPLLARTVVEGFLAGLHRSLFHGFGAEFVHYRNYTPGDDLKYVDWRVYARHDRFQTKVYQEETNTNCYLVLDASASMAYQGRGQPASKLHYAKMLAACLAYLMIKQGDNAGLYAYRERPVLTIAPGHRGDHLQSVCVALSRLQAEGRCDHGAALQYLGEAFNRRGLVILISDFLDADDALFKAIRRLRAAHHECVLFHILDDDELDFTFTGAVRFVDSETQTELVTAPAQVQRHYQTAFNAFLAQMRGFAARHDLDYHQVRTSQPLGQMLAAYLHRREEWR